MQFAHTLRDEIAIPRMPRQAVASRSPVNPVARELSAALGRTISYINVSLDVMKGQLAALGMPPHVVEHETTTVGLHQDNRYDRFSKSKG
jgi:hypothetical protein